MKTLGEVIVKKECEWRKQRDERFPNPTSKFSPFYYDKNITQEKIVEAVRDDQFFGFLNVTMTATEAVRKKYDAVNFPPLFKKFQPKKSDLSEKMQSFFISPPENQLTVGYDAENMTLASNLLKFYINEGYKIETINWAILYQRGKFFVIYMIKFEILKIKIASLNILFS